MFEADFRLPRGQTMLKVLDQSFVSPISEAVPTHHSGEYEGASDLRAKRFDVARRRLFLFVMQNLESLRPGSILLEEDGVRDLIEATSYAQYQLVREAYRLGFRCARIIQKISEDPDRQEARRSLLRARQPSHFTYNEARFELLIDRLVQSYGEAEAVRQETRDCVFITDEDGESLKRRCGRPYRRAFVESAPFMTLENMHRDPVLGFGEITPLFVRRDVYLAFFGHLSFPCGSPTEFPEMSPPILVPPAQTVLMEESSFSSDRDSARHRSRDSFSDREMMEAPSLEDENRLALFQRRRVESYTPSRYSQSIHSQHNDPVAAENITSESPAEEVDDEIIFVVVNHRQERKEIHLPLDQNLEVNVEQLVGRYIKLGFFPFDSGFRALALDQCIRAAMEEADRTLWLIKHDETTVRNFRALHSKFRKRQASEDLNDRPRKFYRTDS